MPACRTPRRCSPRCRRGGRRRAAVLTPGAQATGLPGPVGSDDFVAGRTTPGTSRTRACCGSASTYYAYSTTIANKNLPGADLEGPAHLDRAPSRRQPGTTTRCRWVPTWTHSIGSPHGSRRPGRRAWPGSAVGYVHAYATRLRSTVAVLHLDQPRRPSPTGRSSTPRGPVVCPTDEGAIDPYLWRERRRALPALQDRGHPAGGPSRLFIQRDERRHRLLPRLARGRAAAHRAGQLGGRVVENPAMFRIRDRYYLFYSGNNWASSSYAIGYAICAGPTDPASGRAPPR